MRIMKALAVASLAALSSLMPAQAGDYNWGGSYAGGVVSGGIFVAEQQDYWCWSACDAPTMAELNASIGLQAGHYWQSGNLVYGVVGDISTGFDESRSAVYNTTAQSDFSSEWNYYATLRGRAGLATGNALLFVAAGLAIVDVDYSALSDSNVPVNDMDCADTDVDCASKSGVEVGFAGGVGTAFPVSDNMHMSFEYLFIGLPSEKDRYDSADEDDPGETDDYVNWNTSAHLGRVSLVWELN
jgi:outer membrane immunogenic protein